VVSATSDSRDYDSKGSRRSRRGDGTFTEVSTQHILVKSPNFSRVYLVILDLYVAREGDVAETRQIFTTEL